MTGAHTPGPWFAQVSDREARIWRRDPAELYENGGGVAGDRTIASVHLGWSGEDEQGFPVAANARLIAAAPELLAQLEYAVKLIGAFPTLNGTAQVQSMRDTIAKARTPLPSGSIER